MMANKMSTDKTSVSHPKTVVTSRPKIPANRASSSLRSTPVHERIVLKAGVLAIGVNLLLFVFKIIVSVASGSLAIMSDAMHGLVDTLSGIVVVVSEKIKPWYFNKKVKNTDGKRKSKSNGNDIESHKISHQDIERIGSYIIAIIILFVALHLLIEAVEGIITPEEMTISPPVVLILVIAMFAKITLGLYLRKTGKKVGSETLIASSVETLNDSIISATVLVSSLFYIWWQLNIEAWVSLFVAIFIAKSGFDLLFKRKKSD